MLSTLSLKKQDVKTVVDRYLLTLYADKFERLLNSVDSTTRDMIRKNKQLNEFYDLFLDFILDVNQHLEKSNAQEQIKKLD
jgi:hypothetical protein